MATVAYTANVYRKMLLVIMSASIWYHNSCWAFPSQRANQGQFQVGSEDVRICRCKAQSQVTKCRMDLSETVNSAVGAASAGQYPS